MIQNMRDLGGTETADGRRIKMNCLIRSAQLSQAEEEDLKNIATIVDLRTPGEREKAPDRTWQREYLPMPVFTDAQAGITHEYIPTNQGIPDMACLYGLLIRECSDAIRPIVLRIMEHDYEKGALLWHCSEGKDRCGITAALILEALGVDRETIMADYLKTNLVNLPKAVSQRDRVLATHGQAFADSVYQAFIADERYLNAAWAEMGENYLTGRLGIDEKTIRAFRDAVLI